MLSPRDRPADAGAVPAPEDDEWYLGVDGKLLGPMEMEELARRLERCPPEADVLVWREGMDQWVEPGALPETADLYASGPSPELDQEQPGDGGSRTTGPEDLKDFLERAEALEQAPPGSPPPLLEPVLAATIAPAQVGPEAVPEPAQVEGPEESQPSRPVQMTAAMSRWVVALVALVALSGLTGLAALLLADPGGEPEDIAKYAPPPPWLPKAEVEPLPKVERAPARKVAARPPRVVKRTVPAPPVPAPSQPTNPGDAPLPKTREEQRKWLADVHSQLKDLRKKRGALMRGLADEEGSAPEARARMRKELRQMKYQVIAAHKLRGRLLEALAVGAPPLPTPP